MTSESDTERSTDAPARGDFLFHGIALGGPLEELEALFEKRKRTCSSLGEEANLERLEQAFALARERLLAVLKAPRPQVGG